MPERHELYELAKHHVDGERRGAQCPCAALMQALLRGPVGLRCLWPGCDARGGCLQVDHRNPALDRGPTDVANSDAYCGSPNRIKERGFRPERGVEGTWTIFRPNGAPITPAV